MESSGKAHDSPKCQYGQRVADGAEESEDGKAVHTGTEESQKPNGAGPELSETSDAKVIDLNHGRTVPVQVDEMPKNLRRKAALEPAHPVENLYSLLCHHVWLRAAPHSVNTNQGRATAGIDGASLLHFPGDIEGNLATLRDMLKATVFEPMPVRRGYIPKAHGTKRPRGILTLRDRMVQEARRLILAPLWEADLSKRSYGCRPNRRPDDAISSWSNRLTGNGGGKFPWVMEGDIQSYCDEIPPRRCMQAVQSRGADRDIRA